MDDAILIKKKWYVLATSSRADDRTRVLKQGDTFGLFDRHGDVQHIGIGDQGLYHKGTRFLSRFELTINQNRPMLLNSTVKKDNSLMTVDMTTPDLYSSGKSDIHKGTLHIFRCKLLTEGVQHEHIRLQNFNGKEIHFNMEFEIAADYNDIFQVRGLSRKKSGSLLPVTCKDNVISLGYRGLDNISRHTNIHFNIAPEYCEGHMAKFPVSLQPHQKLDLYINISCEAGEEKPEILSYFEAMQKTDNFIEKYDALSADIFSSNEQFNDWVNRSAADLRMLTTLTELGAYPFAGVPWFSTAFGRDGIITALQYLWLYPEIAKGVLNFLAQNQATEHKPEADAEPGKILHETREGEMAELGEIPFKLYYGSIDSTPLFIILAGEYYDRTGDRVFIESIWTNIQQALMWIDTYGDRDGDGFVKYARESSDGLLQQGWKDSDDSIMHQDGSLAKGPVALCEVQAYVYLAKLTMAKFSRLFGEEERAGVLLQQAQSLKQKFNDMFWCEELSTFAMALDGEMKACKVKSSNAGHLLYTGIVDQEFAQRTAKTLLSDSSFSGWGVRTLDESEINYNPMSYHNGSIWPHDNAMIAMGLARYGFSYEAMQILTGLFDASIVLDLNRLPELFCGFERREGQGPTLYPVACSPQAWASGAVFQLLQACLGMSFSVEKPQIRFKNPQLPSFIHRLQITNLRFGESVIDLAFRQHPNDVGINVLRKVGDIDVAVFM
ncbi:MAG: amylo-alpha-1,6-glucosidase [Gammaproteobacteria bacterium]|nr:amylo-alpha-1,6-glucosidase [Gammaproteobacteria bacterium]